MNQKILSSLKSLEALQHVKVESYQLPDQNQLLSWYEASKNQPRFYCLNTGKYTQFLHEEAVFADFEWLCANEGSIALTPELSAVTIRKPFLGQFIGLSGKSYIWFQPGNYSKSETLELCSLGPDCSTVVVHNIAADRPMIVESWESNTNLGPNFFCTMSAHLLCAGVSSQQSWQYQAGSEKPRTGGLKNLVDVYNFWAWTPFPEVLELGAQRGDIKQEIKAIRDIFFKGALKTVLGMLYELVDYGMGDVEKVAALYKSLYPAWLDALPAKESQYFYLKRAKVNYSVMPNFKEWFFATEAKYQAICLKIDALIQANNKAMLLEFRNQLDSAVECFDPEPSSLLPYRNKPSKKSPVGALGAKWTVELGCLPYLLAQELHLPTQTVIRQWQNLYNAGSWKIDKMGLPAWAKKPCSSDSPMSQLLLDADYTYSADKPPTPVMFDRANKFVYYNELNQQVKLYSPKKGANTKDNLGSIFAKDLIPLWESGVLSTNGPEAQQIVTLMAEISYWTSVRSRLAELVALLLHKA